MHDNPSVGMTCIVAPKRSLCNTNITTAPIIIMITSMFSPLRSNVLPFISIFLNDHELRKVTTVSCELRHDAAQAHVLPVPQKSLCAF